MNHNQLKIQGHKIIDTIVNEYGVNRSKVYKRMREYLYKMYVDPYAYRRNGANHFFTMSEKQARAAVRFLEDYLELTKKNVKRKYSIFTKKELHDLLYRIRRLRKVS